MSETLTVTEYEERAFVALNKSRRTNKVDDLRRRGLLALYARRHSRKMARKGDLYHGHPAAYANRKGIGWFTWAENVGVTPGSPAGLQKAFMDSPPHRANVVNPKLKTVGIGVAFGTSPTGTRLAYETQVFFG